MGDDRARPSFRPGTHYSSVLLQQGRVSLDSDANEAETIGEYERRTLARDVLGSTAFPGATEGAGAFAVSSDGRRLRFGAGHAWIDGVLCEIGAGPGAQGQRDVPDENLPKQAGRYLVYLDVWKHGVTHLEDPSLTEPASDGPDTSTRSATGWQVVLERAPARTDLTRDPSDAQLAARGAYDGPDNRVYRVEIHDAGDADHHRCPLALLEHDKKGWRVLRDLRPTGDLPPAGPTLT